MPIKTSLQRAVWILACVPLAAFAGEANDLEGRPPAKGIFKVGEQDYCFDGPWVAAPQEQWLALVKDGSGWALHKAEVKSGRVKARRRGAQFFIKGRGLHLMVGPVSAATLEPLKGKNAVVTDTKVTFKADVWHWVEWGNADFYLQRGDKRWFARPPGQRSGDDTLAEGYIAVPDSVQNSTAKFRDESDTGVHTILWAGDLNRDGAPDFISYRQVKEAFDTLLWLSERDATGHLRWKMAARGPNACS